jgi:hypothetical protein
MGAQTESMVLFALIFSLVASSFCVAWIVNDYAASPVCVLGQPCAPIALGFDAIPPVGGLVENNYTNTSGYDHNLTYQQDNFFGEFGTWTQGTNGFELTSAEPWWSVNNPVLLLNAVTDVNGVYTVDYSIDNVPNTKYFLTPRRIGQNGNSMYNVKVALDTDGIHLIKMPKGLFEEDESFISLVGAQTTETGGSTIRTVFDKNLDTLSVYKDGSEIATFTGLNHLSNDAITGSIYYGGVGSNSVGFIVKGTVTTQVGSSLTQPTATVNGISGFYDGIVNAIDGIIPGSGALLKMLAIVAQVTVWTLPDAIFPAWLNILLIKTQVVAILYLMARLARGGG